MGERRLTAIMFSDIAGYTAMMQENEEHGKQLAQTYRKHLDERASLHAGKVIQHFGDGSLTIFNSSVEAVQCAKELQESIQDLDIPLRVGIHLGDIALEGQDVFGDGVNIASRVESLGVSGSILFTKRIFEDISSHPEFVVIPLGQFHFKNDQSPRDIYALKLPGYDTPTREKLLKTHQAKLKPKGGLSSWMLASILIITLAIISGMMVRNFLNKKEGMQAGDIHSLLILPFENFTMDDQFDYAAAGMHNLLITDVGRISALRVISPTSAKAYKNMEMPLPEIAKVANVEAVVETNLTCFGDSICIQFRGMAMYPEEKQLFLVEFKEEKSQIRSLNNRICKQFAEEMMIELTPGQERLFSKSRTVDREVYENYLKARSYWDDFRPESLYKALEYLNGAIEKEPEWAPLYTGLVNVWLSLQQLGFEQSSIASPKIHEYLNKANELDTDLADVHYLNGLIAHVMDWDWEKSEKEFLKALAINPNDAISRILYAQLLCILQRNDEAAAQGKLAFELDPLNPLMKVWYGSLLLGIGDCETPLSYGEELVAKDPESYMGNNMIEGSAYRCKEYDKVIQAVKYDLPFPIEEDVFNEIERIYNQNGLSPAYEVIVKHLERFASNNSISFMDISLRCIIANQHEKAMDWIEKGYEMHDPQMTYITTQMYHLDPLFTNPRFIEIVKEMNLPMPKSDRYNTF